MNEGEVPLPQFRPARGCIGLASRAGPGRYVLEPLPAKSFNFSGRGRPCFDTAISNIDGSIGFTQEKRDLALAPLVEAGPGMDSDCGRLIAEVQRPAAKAGR
ncbi:MAG TPA: hypothetical protein VLA64_03675 [Azonexus sp.]|nr:hypothetical protein [Azonexus sp.]